jgi:hypothetical protein
VLVTDNEGALHYALVSSSTRLRPAQNSPIRIRRPELYVEGPEAFILALKLHLVFTLVFTACSECVNT